MKYLALFALALLAGCETPASLGGKIHYTKLTVSDYQGNQVAEWIAEGPVEKTDQGYAIKAIERTSREPSVVTNRFPNGWHSRVVGANIIVQRIEKPDWLADLDARQEQQ